MNDRMRMHAAQNAAGDPAWTEGPLFGANAAAYGPHIADMAPLASGGFVMLYYDSRFAESPGPDYPVRGRIFAANGTPVGDEFQVQVFQNAFAVSVTGLAGGGFAVVFADSREGLGDTGAQLRVQIFDAAGAAVSGQIKIAEPGTGGQIGGASVALESGGFFVTWAMAWNGVPRQAEIRGQLFDAAGNKVGGTQTVAVTNHWGGEEPEVATLEDGGFLVAWSVPGAAVSARRFGADGLPAGDAFTVRASTKGLYDVQVTGLESGGYVVTWSEGGYGSGTNNPFDVFARIYSEAGIALGDAFPVHTEIVGAQRQASVTALQNGGFLVTWNEHDSPSGENSIDGNTVAQMFDASGNRVGGEFDVNAAADGQFHTSATTLAWGGVVIAYGDFVPPGASMRTDARIYSPPGLAAANDGVATNEAAVLNGSVFADNGSGPDTAPDAGILWVSEVNGSAAAVGQQITLPSGARLILRSDGSFSYDPNHVFDALAELGSGASNSVGTDSFTYRIAGGGTATVTVSVTGLYSPPHHLFGTAGADTLNGTGWADSFEGGGGNDIIHGHGGDDHINGDYADPFGGATPLQGGNDTLYGGAGKDILIGFDGDDALYGGADGDSLYGGTGSDAMSGEGGDDRIYTGTSPHNTGHDAAHGGDGADDIHAEHGRVSAYGGSGDDVLHFGANLGMEDVADGGEGLDLLRLGGQYGSLVLSGSNIAGIEWIVLEKGAGGWTHSYTLTTTDSLVAAGDRIRIEAGQLTGAEILNFNGSAEKDGSFAVHGGGANDIIVTGEGDDYLTGHAGADHLTGGLGDDIYGVHDWSDVVVEQAGGGIDMIQTALGSRTDFTQIYALPEHVEQLHGHSTTGQGVRGNSLDNDIWMGAGDDLVVLDDGGADHVTGGGGDDFLYWAGTFTNADRADGMEGYDTLGLLGTYLLAFDATDMESIEKLAVYSSGNAAAPNAYSLTLHDANVAAGKQLTIVAQSLLANEVLTFNGAAETNGSFNVRGGKGADTITGGAKGDVIWGSLGADTLWGGAGNDIFEYNAAAESTGAASDVIRDFTKGDKISLVGVDADGNAANGDSKFAWLGSGAFTGQAGELRVTQHPQNSRTWMVEADVNGDKVADLTIYVVTQPDFVWEKSDFYV